jgi:pyrroline-5-carboxylate reductase
MNLQNIKKAVKVKANISRVIPLPPISLKKGPIPIFPPNRKVKNFFKHLGTVVEIKNEKLSKNFWSTSGMMAPFYELLRTMSEWLNEKGIQKDQAQRYITSLFLALSEDAVVNSNRDLKILVKDSQTPKGLNEQGVNELKKAGFYKATNKTLNSILKRLNRVVLPDPFGPIIPVIEPSFIFNEQFDTAAKPPKYFDKLSICRMFDDCCM